MKLRVVLPLLVTLALAGCGGKEERAATYLARAQAAFDQGDLIKAQLDAKNALQIKPNSFDAAYLLAEIAEQENEPRDMVRFLRMAVEIDPTNVDAQVKMGRIWAAAGQIDMARDAVTAIETADPGNLEGKVLQAIVLMREKKVDEARALANEVLAEAPRNISALAFLASSWQLDDIDKALEYLDQAIEYEPENQSLRVVKVSLLQTNGRLDEAEQELRDLINRFPDENAYRYALARYLAAQSRHEDAEGVLKALVETDPEDLTAKLTLAQYIAQRGDHDDAIELLKGYIKDQPDVYQYRFAMAQTLAVAERYEESRKAFNDIIQRDGMGVHGLSARTKLGALELSQGNMELGQSLIETVLKEEPGNPDALTMRASVAVSEGRTDDAIVDLRSVLRADPGRENAQLLLGKAHLQAGETSLAIETLQKLVESHPNNIDARKDLAKLLTREQRWSEVRELLAVGVEQRPEDLAMARMYIDALIRMQQWEVAEAQADRILELDPTKALGHYVKGRVLQTRGAFEESIDAFQVALDIEPRATETLTALVRSYVRLEDIDGARSFLNGFIEEYPDNPHGLTLLGEIQARAGDWDEAVKSNEAALALQEAWLPAYRNLIGIYLRQEDMDAADDIVARGLKIAPENSELQLLRANIRERQGRFDDAIDIYAAVLQKNPGLDIAANNYIALVADHRPDPETLARARGYGERFENTTNPIFQDTVGWLYYRLGDYQAALPLLEQAVGRAGQLPQLRYHLGMTYYKLDRLELARRELETALAGENPSFTGVDEARATLARL